MLSRLQLLVPSPDSGDLCDTVAVSLHSLRIHPFPTNGINSRPEVASNHSRRSTHLTDKIGSASEDRQLALHLEGLAFWAVKLLDSLNLSKNPYPQEYRPTLSGQYPAFEWNQAASCLNDE